MLLPTSTASNVGIQTFDLRLYANTAEVEAFFGGEIDSSGQDSSMIVPTQESISWFHNMKRIIDNKDYQQEDHAEACSFLGIHNKDSPHLLSMN